MGRWVGLLVGVATTACLTATKSGGEIVDESGTGSSSDGEGHGSEPSESGSGDTGAPSSCAEAPALSCGDGAIDAIEECDGGADCDACRSTVMATVSVDVVVELLPYAVAVDGSSFGFGFGEPPDISLRRYDAAGELIWAYASGNDESALDVAISATGTTYVVGSSPAEDLDGAPWILALDDTGIERWSITLPEAGWFGAIATAADRVAVGGADAVAAADNGANARVQVFDDAGAEQWAVVDPALLWIDDIGFVGDDVIAIAVGPGSLDQIDDTRLVRYDESGEQRWSIALPEDGELAQRGFGVIADAADGTWSFGQAGTGPFLVHHDRDGQELESFDCIGGASGWIHDAALGADGRLALAIDIPSPGQAWFAVLDGGVITRAATLGDPDSGNTAGPTAVQWLANGALAAAWTEYPEEGGHGQSQLVVLSP